MTINFDGLTIDEAVAKATAVFDQAVEYSLNDCEEQLIARGATPEELEDTLRWWHADLLAWRRQKLDEVRAWLTPLTQ